MDDENMKNAKRAADMVMLQNKARDFQDKMTALSNKEYQGRYQGIEIKMKGDFTLINVHIDQSLYETGGKGQIEKAFFTLTNNLVNAIKQESEMMQKEFQEELMRMRKAIAVLVKYVPRLILTISIIIMLFISVSKT